jgi:pimeloyl-ACP methyl ester carboxylesterase
MRERAVRFGESASLVGVVSDPVMEAPSGGKPAVLLLNSGILHHVGASRLYVRIARALAARGFTVLRFDFSGIGDSDVRRDNLPFERSAVLETQEAMTFLEKARDARGFVLMGLCSGADMAFRVAGIDRRVVGVAQLDAWAYRTPGYYLRYYGPRIVRPGVWMRFARRTLASLRPRSTSVAEERQPESVSAAYRRRFPPRAEVADCLRELVARDVHLLYVFTGGQEEHILYRDQYRRSFSSVDFRDRLAVEYLGDADHIFTGLEHQAAVKEIIAEWASERWSDGPQGVNDSTPPDDVARSRSAADPRALAAQSAR